MLPSNKFAILLHLTLSILSINIDTIYAADSFPKDIIIIGDSLSDLGNAPPTSVTIDFPLDIANNVSPITNGVTYAFLLANKLNSSALTPSSLGGTNYAYSGAETFFEPIVNTKLVPSMHTQVQQISSSLSKKSPVFIFGGANDFIGVILGRDPGPFPTGAQVAQRVSEIVSEVRSKGFKTIVVSNLPDLGRPPLLRLNPPLSAILTASTIEFNESLNTILAAQQDHVILADISSLFEEIINHPEIYHLSDAQPNVHDNLNGYAFYYDGFHPAQVQHSILADYYAALVMAPVYTGTLAEDPFSLFRQQYTSIQQQLFPLQPCHECGTIYPFISGNYAPFLRQHINSIGISKTSGGDITLGLTQKCFENLTVGAAVSYAADHNTGRYANDFCFDVSSVSGSLFGSLTGCRWYVNGIFSADWLDFSDIKRSFILGPVKQNAHGSTDGQLYGGLINGGYYVYQSEDSFFTGPIASVEYQYIHVDGYKESGAVVGNLEYKKQWNNSLVLGLGWEFDWNYPLECPIEFCYAPPVVEYGATVSLSANHQYLKGKRDIIFREISLSGVWGAWPVQMDRSTYVSGIANFYAEFSNDMVFSLGYFFNTGSFSMSEHRITAGITLPFGY